MPAMVLTGLAWLAALVARRPELVVIGMPFFIALTTAAAVAQPPTVRVTSVIDRERLLEGEEVRVQVTLHALTRCSHLELTIDGPGELSVNGDRVRVLNLRAGATHTLIWRVRCARWGVFPLGCVRLRQRDALWLITWEGAVDLPGSLRVYPRPQTLRAIVVPAETQASAGNIVSRARGEGIEFAEIRPFVPGDRVRRINWRASTRRDVLQVNDLHPERNTDVILFLDTFADVGSVSGSSLERIIRAAFSLATRYLQERDRVGVIAFGGMLRWLIPGMGLRQRYRLVEAILDTRVEVSYAWKTIDAIPPRTLPPKALVIALTPLLDERMVAALLDLRGRGFDVAVCEVPVAPGARSTDALAALALRVFQLQRETLRTRFHQAGVATVSWPGEGSLDGALEEVRTFRRHVRHGRA
jgi:uncharacterized protein (DUF58 family)